MAGIKKSVKEGKRIVAYYQIAIIFPNDKKVVKPRCTLEEIFETYFINLDKYIQTLEPEELVNKYEQTYKDKGIKVQINFIDSWGHKWSGKEAWPRKEKFIEYVGSQRNNMSLL